MSTATGEHGPDASVGREGDGRVQRAVLDELAWTPGLPAAALGVGVRDGVVTVSGDLDDVPQYLAAKRAVLRVAGVRALVDDLWVRPARSRPDADLAASVRDALRWRTEVPSDAVQATVRNGFVTLTGRVPWEYQRRAAQEAAEHVDGVRRVDNDVELTERPAAEDAADRVRRALLRNAALDSAGIRVFMEGTEAVLQGTVHSEFERRQAEAAVWSSPHVATIRNELHVAP
jgi:osmotically-inducible protein OsmY